MTTNITSTQLDFAEIKDKLKTFFEQQSEFEDYDFEASGLSNVLDVLAYNTHYNGLVANFALNEAFLTSAQLRSSIVGHAETLGYSPRSKSSAAAYLNLSITNTSAGRATTVTLPAYTQFSGKIGNASYVFQTLEAYIATDNGSGFYEFVTADNSRNIPVYEGTRSTKTFLVGDTSDRQIYVIPNASVDTSTLDVKVYNSATSDTYETYYPITSAITVDSTSRFYTLHESPNGFWEIHFSDGFTYGQAPTSGNKIVVTYLSTVGATANGARNFTASGSVSMGGSSYTLAVTAVTNAAGGADKESIESIRANAPLAFASQQRLVTANDYKAQILSRYSAVQDCIAWGGEDNDPPHYGKVMVSLKFQDGYSEDGKTAIKNSIINNLSNNLSMMSMDTEFVDSRTVYVGCQTTFRYNTNLSATPVSIAENRVTEAVEQYFDNNLAGFGSVFRRSNLLATIDDLLPAILNSRMDVRFSREFTPYLYYTVSYNIEYPSAIAAADPEEYIITSNYFTQDNILCRIVNERKSGSTKLQLIDGNANIVVDNIGSYSPSEGKVYLVGLAPTSIRNASTIKVTATPANPSTIAANKNFILQLDPNTSFATGIRET